MKKLAQASLLLVALMVAFAGCDDAKKVADKAKDAADKAKDMANVDFGDFDMDGLTSKFDAITDGFKDVTAENADGLTSKITDLTSSMDGLGIDKLPGPAKTAAMAAVSKFGDTISSLMEKVTDDGILGKLKPVVEALMEKIKAMK